MSEGEILMEHDEITIDLLKIVRALRKKAWAIVLVAAIFGGAMFAYKQSSYVPVYQAKTILFASYTNSRDFSFSENAGSISQSSLSESRSIVNTCYAVLNTRMMMEAVIEKAGLNMSSVTLSGMITTATLNNSELFSITVTGSNPEEVALIANTVADVLPEKVSMVNSNSQVGVIDRALVPGTPAAPNFLKDAVVFAVLGAFLVCCIVAGKEIIADWKEQTAKKKQP